MVKDLVVAGDGMVTFTFLLGRDDPGSLAREVRKAVQGVQGVTGVRVNVTDASSAAEGAAPRQPAPRTGPGGVPPPPTPVELPHLGTVLAISSGKGGVGKSTVSANLAVALARAGHRVGLMDADIYGPNIPRMMGVDQKPEVRSGKIQPLEAHGVKLMSLALIVERDSPAIWRGPIIMKVIGQFVKDVDWGELDYFLVDLPPAGRLSRPIPAGGRRRPSRPSPGGFRTRWPRCRADGAGSPSRAVLVTAAPRRATRCARRSRHAVRRGLSRRSRLFCRACRARLDRPRARDVRSERVHLVGRGARERRLRGRADRLAARSRDRARPRHRSRPGP